VTEFARKTTVVRCNSAHHMFHRVSCRIRPRHAALPRLRIDEREKPLQLVQWVTVTIGLVVLILLFAAPPGTPAAAAGVELRRHCHHQ
jgi:hypothetical protein